LSATCKRAMGVNKGQTPIEQRLTAGSSTKLTSRVRQSTRQGYFFQEQGKPPVVSCRSATSDYSAGNVPGLRPFRGPTLSIPLIATRGQRSLCPIEGNTGNVTNPTTFGPSNRWGPHLPCVTTHAKNIRYLRQQPAPAPRAATDGISG
jgi:hypothetical protein